MGMFSNTPYGMNTVQGRPSARSLRGLWNCLVSEWVSLSNAEKQGRGISKGAGVSVLRAGREIDFGWFFMGGKRKENYDDWWRCEIEFPSELDELFGVTHTKQGITPSEYISELLTPGFRGHCAQTQRASAIHIPKGERREDVVVGAASGGVRQTL